jgi:hypothetical protein
MTEKRCLVAYECRFLIGDDVSNKLREFRTELSHLFVPARSSGRFVRISQTARALHGTPIMINAPVEIGGERTLLDL